MFLQIVLDFYKHTLSKRLAENKIWSYTTGAKIVTTFKNNTSHSYYKYGVFLDFTCSENQDTLQQNSEWLNFNASYHWLVWGPFALMEQTSSALNLCIDSEFVWSYRDESSGLVYMHDVYKVNYTHPAIVTPAGDWNSSSSILNYNMTDYKYEKRKDLQGLVFHAGIVVKHTPLKQLVESPENPHIRENEPVPTYSYSIYQFLMKKFNFSVKLHPTYSYGYATDNGRYEGLVKMIGDRLVDIHVTPMSMNKARFKYMNFIAPTWVFRTSAIFRHPSMTAKADALITPLSPELWRCCTVAWLVLLVVLKLVFIVKEHIDNEEEHFMWSDAFLMVLGSISHQGTVLDSEWVSWRITFLSLLFFTYMTNTYYSASIVSSLLSDPTQTIRTTRDLIYSHLRVGVEQADYNRHYFETNQDPEIREIYTKKILDTYKLRPNYYSREIGTRKVLEEQFAFHVEAIRVYPLIQGTFPEQKKCSLTEVEIFPAEVAYLPVRWSFPYKEMFTYGMRKVSEHGLLNHQNRLWRARRPECMFPGGDVGSVGIFSLVPAFSILAIGLVTGILMLISERLVFSRWERRKNSISKV